MAQKDKQQKTEKQQLPKFDKQGVFDEQIKPLIDEIERLCYRERIPMFAAFATYNDAKTTTYHNAYISPKIVNRELKEDQLKQYIRVLGGYKVIAPRDDTEIPAEFPLDEKE